MWPGAEDPHQSKSLCPWIVESMPRLSDFNVYQTPLDGLLKHRLLGPIPRVSNSVGRGVQRNCIPNKFPGDAYTAGPGTTL